LFIISLLYYLFSALSEPRHLKLVDTTIFNSEVNKYSPPIFFTS